MEIQKRTNFCSVFPIVSLTKQAKSVVPLPFQRQQGRLRRGCCEGRGVVPTVVVLGGVMSRDFLEQLEGECQIFRVSEISNEVGADGARVAFPIYSGNCSCSPLS